MHVRHEVIPMLRNQIQLACTQLIGLFIPAVVRDMCLLHSMWSADYIPSLSRCRNKQLSNQKKTVELFHFLKKE